MKKSIILFLICSFFSGCNFDANNENNLDPLVVVSIPPYIDLTKAIAGDACDVTSAIDKGFDPHTSEVTPKQMKLLERASLWIGIGEFFEMPLLSSLSSSKNNLISLQLNTKIPLIGENSCHHCSHNQHEEKDLHFWLSPKRLKLQVELIKDALVNMMPEKKDLFETNLKTLLEKIDTLDQTTQEKLAPFQGKTLLISHAALGYFCHDYGLIQLAIEFEGKSPSPKSIDTLLSSARKADVQSIFTLPNHNNKGAELIAKELNIDTHCFDPLNENLFETLEKLVSDIISKEE